MLQQLRKNIIDPKENEKQKRRIERMADNFLTPQDIKRIREKLKKTQEGLAKAIGVAPKTFARYENLSVRQSKCMDQLLRILDEIPEAFEILSRTPQTRIKAIDSSAEENDTVHPIKHLGHIFKT